MMIELKIIQSLPAKQFCILMYYAGEAGIEIAKQYGKKPDSGHYQRHVNFVLKTIYNSDRHYIVDIPGKSQRGGERTHAVKCSAVWEELSDDIRDRKQGIVELEEAVQAGDLPPKYSNHVVVTENPGEAVFPVKLFVDAVPYYINDGVVFFVGWLMSSPRRCLISALRKKTVCACVCVGMLQYLAFILEIVAFGERPVLRHD